MSELELYKFINSAVEWHRQENDGQPDILIFVDYTQLESFVKLASDFFDNSEQANAVLKSNYACIWMVEICDYYGIDIDNVFN